MARTLDIAYCRMLVILYVGEEASSPLKEGGMSSVAGIVRKAIVLMIGA